jgi:hypothetical protein
MAMHVTTQREAGPPPTGKDRRLRQLLLALGVVVALALAVAVTWAIASDNGGGPSPGASPSATQAPTGGATEPAPTPSSPVSPPASGVPAPAFGYQPLWPFSSVAAATTWQLAYRSSGAQPWHLDPGLTAVGFTTGHLGFAELNQETSRRIVGREAWIGVGHDRHDRQRGTAAGMDPARMGTAAAVHLARMGAGADAPWEVVGTRDSTLSITAPGYGAAGSSPLTVGGRITGVDEALRVAVIDGDGRTLGRVSGVPAGGENTPWSVTVGFTRPAGRVLTVVVSTGGHVAEVERFAITAVRIGGSG